MLRDYKERVMANIYGGSLIHELSVDYESKKQSLERCLHPQTLDTRVEFIPSVK